MNSDTVSLGAGSYHGPSRGMTSGDQVSPYYGGQVSPYGHTPVDTVSVFCRSSSGVAIAPISASVDNVTMSQVTTAFQEQDFFLVFFSLLLLPSLYYFLFHNSSLMTILS